MTIVVIAIGIVGWRWQRPDAPAAPARIRAIAVLPLANLSGDPGQDYFADGMTEALIADLARLRGVDVISRTSVMQFKGSLKPLRQIARELSVDAVVEGSVIRAGDRVRVTAQLIEGATDKHLWVNDYDREVRDVLALQQDVAGAIAREIRATLASDGTPVPIPHRVDPAAHDLYLKGHDLCTGSTSRRLLRRSDCSRRPFGSTRRSPKRGPHWPQRTRSVGSGCDGLSSDRPARARRSHARWRWTPRARRPTPFSARSA